MLVLIDSKAFTYDELSLAQIDANGYTGVAIGLNDQVSLVRSIHLRKAIISANQSLIVGKYNELVDFWDCGTGTTTKYQIILDNNTTDLATLATDLSNKMTAADASGAWTWAYNPNQRRFTVTTTGGNVRLDLTGNPLAYILGWLPDSDIHYASPIALAKSNAFAERSVLYLTFDEIEMSQNVKVNALDVPNVFCTIPLEGVGKDPFSVPATNLMLPAPFNIYQPVPRETITVREAGLSFNHLTPRFYVMCGTRLIPYNLDSTHFTLELFVQTSQTREAVADDSQYY